MLTKKQKTIMTILGLLGLIIGIIVAVPFRSFPGLNKIENLNIELIVDLVLGAVVILLTIYPLVKKYKMMDCYRESSKVVLTMCYFPTICYTIGAITNLVYTLSFNYSEYSMLSAVSNKALGIIIAVLVVYMVFSIYCILRLHTIITKLDKVGNILTDVFVAIITLCFVVVLFRVNYVYNDGYSSIDEYYLGNPLLFVIYILLLVALGVGIKYISLVVRKDETLVFYANTASYDNLIKKLEYNRAYNDTLDDFENYFDYYAEEYDKLEINKVEEFEEEEEKEAPTVVNLNVNEEPEEVVVADEDIDTNATESEELEEINKQKADLLAQIEEKNQTLAAIREKKGELEKNEEELRKAKEKYDADLEEFNQFKLDHVKVSTDEEPKQKIKNINPPFEKIVEYAKSFAATNTTVKVAENAKGNLLKFSLGKKMYLVLQATNNDYRINFIASSEKFVDYIKTSPDTFSVPKNLKGNNWLRFVNKGKADIKIAEIRKYLKDAYETAEKQIAAEAAAKAAERKAKAAERAKERAAKRAAEKAAAQAQASDAEKTEE